jgi:hypothetical protein
VTLASSIRATPFTPAPSMLAPLATLRMHLTNHLAGEIAWEHHLQLLERGRCALHLAIFREPFVAHLLAGRKTVESRFSRVRCAPYQQLDAGDLVAVKRAAGPVVGVFVAGRTRFLEANPPIVARLRAELAEALCAADTAFWDERADARYVSLVDIDQVALLPPLPFSRRDRRGWVVLTHRRSTGQVSDE